MRYRHQSLKRYLHIAFAIVFILVQFAPIVDLVGQVLASEPAPEPLRGRLVLPVDMPTSVVALNAEEQALLQDSTASPTPTSTITAIATSQETPTATLEATGEPTATPSPEPSESGTLDPTLTPLPTLTPTTEASEATNEPTATPSPSQTPTQTATPTPETLVIPSLLGPTGITPLEGLTFDWEVVAEATGYRLEVEGENSSSSSDYEADSICVEDVCSVTLPISLSTGDYTWRVQASKGDIASDWSDWLNFSLEQVTLAIPIALQPSGSTARLSPTFSWNPVAGANAYNLLVESELGPIVDATFEAAAICDEEVCQIVPDAPFAPETLYAWSVRASNTDLISDWSSPLTFTVLSEFQVELITPADIIAIPTPTFQWLAIEEAARYQFQLLDGKEPINDVMIESEAACLEGICRYLYQGLLLEETDYTWQVRPILGTYIGEWSDAFSLEFDDPIISVDQIAPTQSVDLPYPTFTWGAVSEIEEYQLLLADDEDILLDATLNAAVVCDDQFCQYTVETKLNVGGYYWQVIALDPNAEIEPEEATVETITEGGSAFRINNIRSLVTLEEPSEYVRTGNIPFIWSTDSQAIAYQIRAVQLSDGLDLNAALDTFITEPDLEAVVDAELICSEESCLYQPEWELAEVGYIWQVQAQYPNGLGGWSEPLTFFVIADEGPELDVTIELEQPVIVAGEEVQMDISVRNQGEVNAHGLRMRNELPAGIDYAPLEGNAAGPAIRRESDTRDLVGDIEQLEVGETETFSYRIRAQEPQGGPAEVITDTVQISVPGLDTPLLEQVSYVVVGEGVDWMLADPDEETTLRAEQVEVVLPPNAVTNDQTLIIFAPAVEADQQPGVALQFTLSELTLPADSADEEEGTDEKALLYQSASDILGFEVIAPGADKALEQPTLIPESPAPEGSRQRLFPLRLPFLQIPDEEPTPEPDLTPTDNVTDGAYEQLPSPVSPPIRQVPGQQPTPTTPDETPAPSKQDTNPEDEIMPEKPMLEEYLDADLSANLDQREPIIEQDAVTFDEHVEVKVSFDTITDLGNLQAGQTPFVAVFDTASGIWVRQPVKQIDSTENTVIFETSHFSTWGAGVAGTFPENGASALLYDEAQVSTFTGTAQFNYPIWVPAGRGGMQPDVSLSYSSGAVDGLLGDIQSPWVGVGWNIDAVEISRLVLNGGCNNTETGEDNCGSGVYGYKDEYVMAFNGASYELIENPNYPGRYHTKEESFLYIQRHSPNLNNEQDNGQSPNNATEEWWEIVTSDGTRYRLGWNGNSEQRAPMLGYTPTASAYSNLGYAGEASDRVALRWRVDLVEDVHGNVITYTYDEEKRDVAGTSRKYDHASYLATIRYTGTSGSSCNPSTEACFEVRFERATRAEGYDIPGEDDLNDWDTYDSDYLDKVQIYALTGTTETLLREYDLNYIEVNRSDSDSDYQAWEWDSIVLSEIVVSGGGTTAPRTTFSYGNYDNRAQQSGYPEWGYPRLTEMRNGTGGEVRFEYVQDGRPADEYFAWRVLWREVLDGVTSNVMRSDYQYGNACYENDEDGWCNNDDAGALVGHEWALERVRNFDNAIINQMRYEFHTDEQKSGRAYRVDTRDASGTTYFRSETDYTVVDNSVNAAYPDEVFFTYASETRDYERQSGSLDLVTRQTYTYESTYGTLTEEVLFGGDSTKLRYSQYSHLDSGFLDIPIGSWDFDTDTSGFTYNDDPFRSTNQPTYAEGDYVTAGGYNGTGGLRISVGGVDGTSVTDGMSGGWEQTFTLTEATDVQVSLRYRLDVATNYEADEYGQALVAIDGILVGVGGNDYLQQIADGGDSGWQQVTLDLGTLSAGSHTIALGGYNNKKTAQHEQTLIYFDDVFIERASTAPVFLHSFPRSVLTYDGDDDSLIAASYYAYDGTVDDLGTVGLLTLEQTRTLINGTETVDATYTYDTYGNLISTRAYGNYGTLGTLPTADANKDRVSSVTYDTIYHAFPLTQTNPLGHTVTTTYDFQLTGEMPLGLPRKVQDPNGATTETFYDGIGRVTEVWQPGATQASIKTIFPALDSNGDIPAPYTIELQIWDPSGPGSAQYRSAWGYYDGLGRIIRTLGPAENTNAYIRTDVSFNAQGQVDRSARPYEVTLSSPPGSYIAPTWSVLTTTTTEYDDFGRVVQITAPDGSTVQTEYNGRTTAVIDPNGHRRESTLDDFGRMIAVREYTGSSGYTLYATTQYLYDARDLLTKVTDAASNETLISYDELGRKTSMVDPDMGWWQYEYDIWNQLSLQEDGRGAEIQFTYDIGGRVTEREARDSSSDPWETVASYTYDDTTGGNYGTGRLTSMDSNYVSGSPTVADDITYDLLGRPISTTRTIDGTAYTVSTGFDSLGRVTSMTYPDPDGAGSLTAETVNYTYNRRGLLESMAGDDTYIGWLAYDATGNLTHQSLGNGVVTIRSYDEDSNRLERIYTAKPAFTPLLNLEYQFDAAGNVTEIEDAVNNETRTFEYDDLDRLTYAGVYDGAQMIEERRYTYDQIGNMLSFNRRFPSAQMGHGFFGVGGAADSTNYAARVNFTAATGRMSGSNYQGQAVSPYVGGFGAPTDGPGWARGMFSSGDDSSSSNYQSIAGFNSMVGGGSSTNYEGEGVSPYVRGIDGSVDLSEDPYSGPTGEESYTYTYGELGAGPHMVTSLSNGDAFAYDGNGNMVSRTQDSVTWTHTFDAENRLINVTDGTTNTSYTYDGNGNRIKRVVNDGSTTTTTLYVAGMEIELVGSTEQKRTIYYGQAGAFRVIDGTDAGLYFRHGDHLGSTSVLSDSNGDKVSGSDVLYTPFGDIREGSQSELTDFGYTGQRLDSSTGGLMFYNARYYAPKLRRFISADTIVPSVTNAQDLNRFSYVRNNPIRFTDPTGHASCGDDMGCWVKRYERRAAAGLEPKEHNYKGDRTSLGTGAAAYAKPDSQSGTKTTQQKFTELEEHGVLVIFDNDISDIDVANSIDVIHDAVVTMATSMQDLFEAQGYGSNSALAFKAAFGKTVINVITGNDAIANNSGSESGTRSGINHGYSAENGSYEITLGLNPLLSERPEARPVAQGLALVAHEIAHNMASGSEGLVGTPPGFNIVTFSQTSNDVNINSVIAERSFGVLAGSDSYTSVDSGGFEVTADAIASWALGDFRGLEGSQVSNQVETFLVVCMFEQGC